MHLIEKNILRLKELCKKYSVKKMYAFGSVLNEKFSISSDVDLLVELENVDVNQYADNYFGLKFSLEKLLKKALICLKIKQSKTLIYG